MTTLALDVHAEVAVPLEAVLHRDRIQIPSVYGLVPIVLYEPL